MRSLSGREDLIKVVACHISSAALLSTFEELLLELELVLKFGTLPKSWKHFL
jgi:hypothetical protein